jgi:hypothetical protein
MNAQHSDRELAVRLGIFDDRLRNDPNKVLAGDFELVSGWKVKIECLIWMKNVCMEVDEWKSVLKCRRMHFLLETLRHLLSILNHNSFPLISHLSECQ